MEARQALYDQTLLLIQQNEVDFVFHNSNEFFAMDEIHQVSSVAEDLLTTISVQCTDLVCHMLLLYADYPNEFHTNLENSTAETLRLYPLTDLWTRQSFGKERAWIASLVQLNRNGWSQPDMFIPQRWETNVHPPLMSWGFDVRRCPAQKLATSISQLVFKNIIKNEDMWIKPARNFQHERTFPYGVQAWIGYGEMPIEANSWNFEGKFQMQCRRWLCEKLRMIDQNELN